MSNTSARPVARRLLLRGTSGAGLGIATLALPSAARAASPSATPTNVQTLQVVTIDDTVEVAAGHDLTLNVRLIGADGTPFNAPASVSTIVTRDDGSAGGSHPVGLRIDGADVTVDAPTVTRTLTADDGGTLDISIDVPDAGNYLVRLETNPSSLANPNGVTLSFTLA